MLGKAFCDSSVTYHPTDSIASVSGSTQPLRSTLHSATSTDCGERVYGSSSQVFPMVSSVQEQASGGSLSYCNSQSSSTSTCDSVFASVLKSIGFNLSTSKFASTVVPKEQEESYASTLQAKTVPYTQPQPVQGYSPVSSPNLSTPLKASTTACDKTADVKTFSEIDEVLQEVHEYTRSKLRSPSAVKKEQVRSRSRHRSSPESDRSNTTACDKAADVKTFSEIDKVLQKVHEYTRSKLCSPSAVKKEQVRSRSGHRSSPESDKSAARQSPRSVVPKEHEESYASTLHTETVLDKVLQKVHEYTEIDKVLQKVREYSRSKMHSPSAVKKERSRHRSSPESDRSAARQSTRSATKQKQKKLQNEQWKHHSVERSERQSSLRRDELHWQASTSPWRHDASAQNTSDRKSHSARSSSSSSSSDNRHKPNVHERHLSPKTTAVQPRFSVRTPPVTRENSKSDHKKRGGGEKEQSHDNTSCLKASIPSTGEQLDQSDRKRSEQAHQQRKPPVRSDRRSRHSEQLVKEKKIVVKEQSRNMSDNNSLKFGADLRQRFMYRTHGLYKQGKSYSHSGTKAGFTQYGSRKHEKHDSFAKHLFRDHSSHYVMRRRNRGGKYQERSSRRQEFSNLEDISSDEEENVEYRDGGNHCCRFCNVTFETIPGLLEHLQSAAHEQVSIFL